MCGGAGSISWEPVSFAKCEGGQEHEGGRCEGANVVRFTLRTAWTRTGGTFVKVVDGIASPADNYQPVSGDTVKVTGREAPKFLVSSGEEFLLEVKVTSNTAQTPDTNDPQQHGHWTYSSTNWIEGTSEYLVTLPRTDITYVAELHGCCREKREIENTRHSRGITHMYASTSRARARTHTYAHTHARSRAHTERYAQTDEQTHTKAHTHAHTLGVPPSPPH